MTDEEKLNSEELENQDDSAAEGDEGGDEKESLQDELKRLVVADISEIGTLRKKLVVTIPRETIERRMDDQYVELRRDAAVPGFRKGRAPRRLLEKRFGSEVSETLVQQVVSTGYMAAVEREDLKIIGDPLIWAKEEGADSESLVDVQKAIELMTLPAEGDLSFSCEIEVRPEFELPELDNIPIEKPILTVSEEDVNVHMERVRSMRGTYETAEDGIAEDDMVVADVKMTSGDTVLKEQEDVQLSARPQQVDGVQLENLGKDLKGKKVGDVVKTSGEIGDDYIKEEFRGEQGDFEFTIKEVNRLKLPEMNDEFVKSIGFESESELREFVTKDLESRLGEEVKRGMSGQVYKYLLDNTKFDVPSRLSERQAERVMMRRMLEMYQQGIPPQEVEKHIDELKTSSKEDTVRDLKVFFLMETLSEKIEVDVSEAELNGMIANIAQRQGKRFDRVRDEMAKGDGLTNIYLQIRDSKIVDDLLSKAKITETEPSDKPEKAEKPKAKAKKKSTTTKKKSSDSKAGGKGGKKDKKITDET